MVALPLHAQPARTLSVSNGCAQPFALAVRDERSGLLLDVGPGMAKSLVVPPGQTVTVTLQLSPGAAPAAMRAGGTEPPVPLGGAGEIRIQPPACRPAPAGTAMPPLFQPGGR